MATTTYEHGDHDHGDMTTTIMTHDAVSADPASAKSMPLRGGEMDPKFFPRIEKITQMEGPNILAPQGHHCAEGRADRRPFIRAST